jgi:hypothetical protein
MIRWILLSTLICTASLTGCSESDTFMLDIPDIPPPSNFKSLEQKDDILNNLLFAYNERDYQEVERLLDDNFVFYFSPNDVRNGIVAHSSWTSSEEMNATTNLFDAEDAALRWSDRTSSKDPSTWGLIKEIFYDTDGSTVKADKIYLELTYEEGIEAWDPITPPDPESYPDEVWYEKRVEYWLAVEIAHVTYTQDKTVLALFTIRPVKADGKDIWQIVAWHDDIGN